MKKWIGLVTSILIAIACKLYFDAVINPTRLRSFALQTLSFFSRPVNNDEIVRSPFPIHNSAAWYAEALKKNESLYRMELSQFSKQDLIETTKKAFLVFPSRILLKNMMKKDFLLSNSTVNEIEQWRLRLHPSTNGIGFLIVSGMPVFELEENATLLNEVMFFGLGFYFGIPGAQNSYGELVGNIADVGIKNNEKTPNEKVRQYMTSEKLDFHADAADVVALLTLKNHAKGGESRVVSSVTVYNELIKKHPHLKIAELFQTQLLDTRDGKGTGFNFYEIIPLAYEKKTNLLRSFFHCEYFRTAYTYNNSPTFRKELQQVIDAYCELADQLAFDMVLKKGDLQLVNNHYCLHGRYSYEETQFGNERHLLRLWISINNEVTEFGHAWNLKNTVSNYLRQRIYFGLF